MMQQLAAKQSDIAALDVGKGSAQTETSSAKAPTQESFTDFIRQVSSSEGRQSSKNEKDPAAGTVKEPARPVIPAAESSAKKSAETVKDAPRNSADADTTSTDVDNNETVKAVLKDEDADIDWLAYVDAVKSAEAKLAGKGGDNHDGNALTEEEEALLADALLAIEEVTKGKPGNDQFIEFKDALERRFTTPVEPVITELTAQLEAAGDSEEITENLKALAGVLLTAQEKGGIKLNSDSVLASLAEAMPGEQAKSVQPGELIAQALAKANTASGDAEQSEQDQSLLVSMLKNELKALKTGADGGGDTQPVSDAATLAAESLGDDSLSQLMKDMQSLSEPSADAMTEALSSKIVALMPNASAEQQQTVKNTLVAGIAEMQQQLAKGHEPGLDLKAVIQQAMVDANVTPTQSMMTQIEQQAAQLHQIASTTQQTMQQVIATQLVSTDTVIQENSQVRSEAGKAQQTADAVTNKPVNINRPEGHQQLQEKIRWMVNSRHTLAEIRLDPPELGSMQVRVNMNGDAASVNFVVQSQQARDALNDAMPRLRDMLSEQGIELGESFVQQDSGGEGEDADGQLAGGNGQLEGETDEDTEVREQPLTRQETGGIDYYA